MSKVTKHITTYLTIFSLLFSSLGITIYYHHCNKEQITLKSVIGKIQCEHHEQTEVTEENHQTCCHHSENSHNECSTQENQKSNELSLGSTSCCVDMQITKQLNTEFFANSKQKVIDNQIVDQNKNNKSENDKNILTQTKDYLDKKIIQPIKKFISLLRQLSKIAAQSDNEDSTY